MKEKIDPVEQVQRPSPGGCYMLLVAKAVEGKYYDLQDPGRFLGGDYLRFITKEEAEAALTRVEEEYRQTNKTMRGFFGDANDPAIVVHLGGAEYLLFSYFYQDPAELSRWSKEIKDSKQG